VPSPETVGAILEAAQQDLTSTIPALLALAAALPSRKALSSEREQGELGGAVSGLIQQLAQIHPKSRPSQDCVEKAVMLIKDACSQDQAKVIELRKGVTEESLASRAASMPPSASAARSSACCAWPFGGEAGTPAVAHHPA